MNNYSNVFHPSARDDSWETEQLEFKVKDLSVNELLELKSELETRLIEVRSKEPARKRNNKSEYRWWIKQTHDILDCLEVITKEISSR